MAKTLTPYTPETSFTRLPDMIDRLFRDSWVVPTYFDRFFDGIRPVNLLETEKTYIIQLFLFGVDVEKLQIQVAGRQLTVKATCVVPIVENATYLFQGLTTTEFSEVFTLPAEVDGEKAEAFYNLGILAITLPKAEHVIPKAVKVHTPV